MSAGVAPCAYGVCDGSGWVDDEASRSVRPCRCRPALLARRRARSLSTVIPSRYRGIGFDRPPVTEMPEAVVRAVRHYVRDLDARIDAGRGLWLFGPNGTGKTTLSMLVAAAALEHDRTVAIYSLPRLLAELRTTFDERSDLSYTALLDRLTDVDLLHLDDVGAEKTSPWVLEQLYAIVNARYEAQRSVVLTTNLQSAEELAEQITRRTVSRLEEMCEVLPLYGEDHRTQVA